MPCKYFYLAIIGFVISKHYQTNLFLKIIRLDKYLSHDKELFPHVYISICRIWALYAVAKYKHSPCNFNMLTELTACIFHVGCWIVDHVFNKFVNGYSSANILSIIFKKKLRYAMVISFQMFLYNVFFLVMSMGWS